MEMTEAAVLRVALTLAGSAIVGSVQAGEQSLTTSEGLTVETRDGNLMAVRLAGAGGRDSGSLLAGHYACAAPLGIETPGMVPVNLLTSQMWRRHRMSGSA